MKRIVNHLITNRIYWELLFWTAKVFLLTTLFWLIYHFISIEAVVISGFVMILLEIGKGGETHGTTQ